MFISLDLESLLRPQRDQPPVVHNTAVVNPVESDVEQSSKRTAQDKKKDRCSILRPVSTDDITGGSSSQYVQVGSFPCFVYEAGVASEGTNGIVVVSDAPYNICLPPEANIRPDDIIGVPGFFNAWKPNFSYGVGDRIVPHIIGGNGHFYETIKAGESGAIEPGLQNTKNWPTGAGSVIASGSVLFKEMGDADFYQIVGTNDGMTRQDELVVRCKKVSY